MLGGIGESPADKARLPGANEQLGINQMQQRDDNALHCGCRALERPDPLNSEVSGNLRICLQDQI